MPLSVSPLYGVLNWEFNSGKGQIGSCTTLSTNHITTHQNE